MNKRTIPTKQKQTIVLDQKLIAGLAILAVTAVLALVFLVRGASTAAATYTMPQQTIAQWAPFAEWQLNNPSYSGNPFDVEATATFTHSGSGETRTTPMFYDGNNRWKFRFTGTQPGEWTFTTSSADPELNGQTGLVNVSPNANGNGFVTHVGNKWVHGATGQPFVPQLVMTAGPHYFYNNETAVNQQIDLFINQHGFNGLHIPVFCRWVNLDEPNCVRANSTDPDPRTFEALESIISKTYAAGGTVHLWMWTDNADRGNPNYLEGGINGPADMRLQRYIAARLGPLPGWTMGYGFDLFEWTTDSQLTTWHNHMQSQMGWSHYLGARSSKNQLDQLSEAMDYSSYEQHKPSYETYVQTIDQRPFKPSFSEDRFRIRSGTRAKDYNMEETRRGLWHSTMAGGVANIWGNMLGDTSANDALGPSLPYPNPEMIKTYATFFNGRFLLEMSRCNQLTSGTCLKVPSNAHYVFYQESTNRIQMDLSGMPQGLPAVAIDTTKGYAEINLGTLPAANQVWTAPYASDWAIAVGDFSAVPVVPDPQVEPPQPEPPQPEPTNTPIPQPTATTAPPETSSNNCFQLGINVPWYNGGYGADFATVNEWNQHTYNSGATAAMFDELAAHNVNTVRWWVFADGRGAPEFDNYGRVSGLDQGMLADMNDAVQLAKQRGITIWFTLWSFDMLGPGVAGAQNSGGHDALFTNNNRLDFYVENALRPMLNYPTSDGYTLASHPNVVFEITNEIEFAINEFGPSSEVAYPVSLEKARKFVAVHAGEIARAGGTSAIGHAAIKYVGGPSEVLGGYGDIWNDAALQVYDANASIDIYAPHYYGWMNGDGVYWNYNPLHFYRSDFLTD